MPTPGDRPSARLGRLAGSVRRAVLRRRRPLAGLLGALAVVAAIQATAADPPARVQVLVATRDLPSGVVLGAGDLTRAAYAPGTAPDGLVAGAVGHVLAAPLRRGEPVTDVRLVGPALTRDHPGLSAVPVRLPDAGMVALLRVGDHVDLVAADPQGSAARVVGRGVPVLALPREPSTGAAVGDGAGTGVGALPGRLVVVGVPDAEVPQVADAAVRYFLTVAFGG